MSEPPQDGSGQQDGQGGQGGQGQGAQGAQGAQPPQGRPPQGGQPFPGGPQPGYPQQDRPPQQGGYPPPPGLPPQPGYPPTQGFPPQPGLPPQPGYPGQPYGPQPGAYGVPGPGGRQPVQPGPYPPGPYPPGPSPVGPQPAKKRTSLFVLIGVGALALILTVVAVAVNIGGTSEGAGGTTAGTGTGTASGGASAPPAPTASDAVNGYLRAVAKGDAQAAVAYAADPSTVSTKYMTPKVLAASAKLAPLTDIQVGPSDPDATTVPVTYQLGSTPVSTSIDVVKSSDGTWKLVNVASDLDLTSVKDDEIPMLMNGTKVTAGSFSVLPGAYRFTTGQRNFDYGKHPDVIVRYPSDYPDTSRLAPGVTRKARSAALSALRKSWSSCLKSRDPKPRGCPNRWNNDSYRFKKGTVRWSRKGSDPVKKPRATTYSTYTIYTVKIDLALKGTCSSNGRTGTCTGSLTGGSVLARADYSASKIKVSWQT